MKVLAKSIYAHHDNDTASDLYTYIARRLYREEAPSTKNDKGVYLISSEFPYIVYKVISDVPIGLRYEVTDDEILRIQFDIWSNKNGAGQSEDIYEAMKKKYDNCYKDLVITGYKCVYFRRDIARLNKDPDTGYWRYIVDYRTLIQKT